MDYVDASGCPRNYGEGFVDASNCYRRWGDDFVDYDGIPRRFGEPFVDKSGFMRTFGSGFVDGEGIWREPHSSLRFSEQTGYSSNENSSSSDSEQLYEPIDISNITSDDLVNGLSLFEKLFRYILIFTGLYLSGVVEPIIFLILIFVKKAKKDNKTNALNFAVVLSGIMTIEWVCALFYLVFYNREVLIRIYTTISSFFGSL